MFLLTERHQTECSAFSPVVRIGTPHPQASVFPPFVPGGGTPLAGEGVGSRFGREDSHCGTLGI
jgi:hypothetical protein